MTGGPVDVVIETGIASAPRQILERDLEEAPRADRVEPAAPVFTRAPRTFGHAVNE